MKLSKTILLIPAASLLIAAAIGSGACSTSVSASTGIPTVFPKGVDPGGACSGEIYFADQDGFFACEGGVWVAEGSGWEVPAMYTVDGEYSDGFDSGDTSESNGGTDTSDTSDTSATSETSSDSSGETTDGTGDTSESNTSESAGDTSTS